MKEKERCECHECTQSRLRLGGISSLRKDPDEERQETDAYIEKRNTRRTIENLTKTVQRYAFTNAQLLERLRELETKDPEKKKK